MQIRKRNVFLAALCLALGVLAVAAGFIRLSQTDPALSDRALTCTEQNQNGWCFYTEDGAAQPQFGFGGYLRGVSAEGVGPVVAERIMEDVGQLNILQLSYCGVGVEVYLDDVLLYTDFPNAQRLENGFVADPDPSTVFQDDLRLTLSGCTGKILRIVTYTEAYDGLRQPVTPVLCSRYTDAAIMSAGSVLPLSLAVVLCILALSLFSLLLLGAHNARAQWPLLPLGVYFLLLCPPVLTNTFLLTAAGLDSGSMNLLLGRVSIDALLCFLALETGGWRKWVLFGCAAAHTIVTALWAFLDISLIFDGWSDSFGFFILLLSLGLCVTSRRKLPRRGALCVLAVGGLLLGLYGLNKLHSGLVPYELLNPVTALLLARDCRSFNLILCAVAALISVVWVVSSFIRGELRRRTEQQSLQARSELIQASYDQTLDSLQRTQALRHEWKNHIVTLRLLEQKGDPGALREYLERLDLQLDQLSGQTFTANLTVNTIAQRFSAQAKTLGIAFQMTAPLPHTLSLDQGDLCSFLFNLLDNALEAAAKLPPEQARQVVCSLQIRQAHLAIRCQNTYDGQVRINEHGKFLSTKADPEHHGLGLAQMQKIAEKYGSTLSISRDADTFTVMTALKLP